VLTATLARAVLSRSAMQQRNHRPRRQQSRKARVSLVLLALSSLPLVLCLSEREARADCASPEPAIVWSYPAQGDTDVPTNVDLWVLPSGWGGPPSVSRNGVVLAPLRMGYGYDAGELAPNTAYTFQVQLDNYGDPGAVFELTFTTGNGPAAPDPGAAPGDVVTSSSFERALADSCKAALGTQDCFDTGQDTYYQFTPAGSAKGWILVSDSAYRPIAIWPGECEAPTLFRSSFSAPCATLYGIDASGELHPGQHVCTEAATPVPDSNSRETDEPPPSAPVRPPDGEPSAAANENPSPSANLAQSRTDGGCSISRPRPTTALAAATLGLSLAALARIRRRSRRAAGR
jgi:hypothetical protein